MMHVKRTYRSKFSKEQFSEEAQEGISQVLL